MPDPDTTTGELDEPASPGSQLETSSATPHTCKQSQYQLDWFVTTVGTLTDDIYLHDGSYWKIKDCFYELFKGTRNINVQVILFDIAFILFAEIDQSADRHVWV